MRNEFTAVFVKAEEGGYWAYCLEISANGQGETVEECKEHLMEGIRLMLGDRRDRERRELPAGSWEEVIEIKE
jgi:predicted RNase H-like HicB family nuclease